jgi:hypothetical protein
VLEPGNPPKPWRPQLGGSCSVDLPCCPFPTGAGRCRPEPVSRLAAGHPEGLALTPARTLSSSGRRERAATRGSCRCRLVELLGVGAQVAFVVDGAAHADRGVFAVAVVLVDPGRDAGTRLGFGGEALEGAQFELQRAVPAFDDGVIEGRPDPAHGLLDAESFAGSAEGLGRVFAALDALLLVKGWVAGSSADGWCAGARHGQGRSSALAARHRATVSWDETSASAWFRYTSGGTAHTVWFENAQAMASKVQLATKAGARGVTIWNSATRIPPSGRRQPPAEPGLTNGLAWSNALTLVRVAGASVWHPRLGAADVAWVVGHRATRPGWPRRRR